VPEPQGRTFAELDLLFERRVPARGFARADADVFGSAEAARAVGAEREKEDGEGEEQGAERGAEKA
jgi:SP family general alpha glucoside:H+ symporter-like MFS transporter